MNIREATKNDCVHMDALLTKLIRYEARFDPNLSSRGRHRGQLRRANSRRRL